MLGFSIQNLSAMEHDRRFYEIEATSGNWSVRGVAAAVWFYPVRAADAPYCFLYILDNGTDLTGCRLAFGQFSICYNKRGKMAREIRETPILFGEDARRFLARMEERHPEPPEVRAQRLRDYEFMKKAYERGMAEQRAREAANGGLDPWFKHV